MSPRRRLLAYLARSRRAFLTGFACVVMTTAVALAGPWLLKFAIDDLLAGATLDKVRFYSVALLGLAAVGGVFRFLMRRIIIGASREVEYALRNDFFATLQRLDVGYFQRNRTGDLMSRATNDLNAVRMMIGPAVMYTANTVITFVVALMLMLSINRRLTLLALIPLPGVTIIVKYFGSAIHRRFESIQEQLSTISAVTQETLSGVRVVRAYGQEPFELERFRLANQEYMRRSRGLVRLEGMYFPSMGLLMGIGALVVLWLGSGDVVAGRMSIGDLVAFNAYLMMLSWPLIAFGWVTNLLQRGLASWKRMIEVFDAVPAITDAEASGALTSVDAVRGEIEFRNLTFGYADRVVLREVSAVMRPGETTAIVGATGSGKTTLLNLLPRLHQPPPGTVLVDGVDVRQIPLRVLRGAIGFVPQEPFLFSTTIADNIALGASKGQRSRDRIEQVARIARLDQDLPNFANGYDTVIGERGITLSGGQKQRTAIARALAVEPRILILDDALSAVDTYTEEAILGGLNAGAAQRTTLLVSHRISTVRHAQQILVLDDGRIVERGTHDELVERGGIYAGLHRKQLLEEELAAS
ncbi:MAG: ABC transporter ATP-binding protein [Vicinamibacterales bacterium]